jgi:hypothetical protein
MTSRTCSRFRSLAEGERIGKLVVLSKGDDGVTYFLRCDCGKRVTRRAIQLLGCERTTHCGCSKKGPPKRNHQGQLVRLVVQASLLRSNAGKSWWDVELECGHKILGHEKTLTDPPLWAGCRKCTAEAEPQEIHA